MGSPTDDILPGLAYFLVDEFITRSKEMDLHVHLHIHCRHSLSTVMLTGYKICFTCVKLNIIIIDLLALLTKPIYCVDIFAFCKRIPHMIKTPLILTSPTR